MSGLVRLFSRKGESRKTKDDLEQLKRRTHGLIRLFRRQKFLLVGGHGTGKSSLINSISYTVNRCKNDYAAFEEVAEVGAGNQPRTCAYRRFSAAKGMYSDLEEEEKKEAPEFFDMMGLPNRQHCIPLLRGLVEGKLKEGEYLTDYLEAERRDKANLGAFGDRDEELACWGVIYVINAQDSEQQDQVLVQGLHDMQRILDAEKKGMRVFVAITKSDVLKPTKKEKTLQKIFNYMTEQLNIRKGRVKCMANFTDDDMLPDGTMDPTVDFEKRLSVVNALTEFLKPSHCPEWAQTKKSAGAS